MARPLNNLGQKGDYMLRIQYAGAVLIGSLLTTGCSGGGSAQDTAAVTPPVDQQAVDQTVPPAAPSNEPASPPPPAPRQTTPPAARSSRPQAPPQAAPLASARTEVAPAAAPAPSRATVREVTVPTGTALALELTTALTSATAQVETPVQARLREAISVDGVTVIPAGSTFSGAVTDVERAGRVRGRARLVFRFTEATINGQKEPLRTNALTFEAESTTKADAAKIGAGAIGGAIIGAIAGGGDGAAKGAAIGGGAGTGVVLATRGREVIIEAGTPLSAVLAVPADLLVPIH